MGEGISPRQVSVLKQPDNQRPHEAISREYRRPHFRLADKCKKGLALKVVDAGQSRQELIKVGEAPLDVGDRQGEVGQVQSGNG